MHGSDANTWDKLVALKQKQIADDIPLEWRLPSTLIEKYRKPDVNLIASDVVQSAGLLSQVELQITETKSATEIARQLKAGELSSVAVTTAFSKRAAIAQQLVCSTSSGISTRLSLTSLTDIMLD
jgi:amidase